MKATPPIGPVFLAVSAVIALVEVKRLSPTSAFAGSGRPSADATVAAPAPAMATSRARRERGDSASFAMAVASRGSAGDDGSAGVAAHGIRFRPRTIGPVPRRNDRRRKAPAPRADQRCLQPPPERWGAVRCGLVRL